MDVATPASVQLPLEAHRLRAFWRCWTWYMTVGELFGFGFVALAMMLVTAGGAQWVVLRHHAPRAAWWIIVNAVGWPLGVLLPMITITLVPDGASEAWFVVAGIGGGVLMGLMVGALTGAVMAWLARDWLAGCVRAMPRGDLCV